MPNVKRIASAIICLLVTSAWSAVVPSPGSESVPLLFSSASLVFKGEVSSVAQVSVGRNASGESGPTRFVATVLVDRLYKGDAPGGAVHIEFDRPSGAQCTVSPCLSLKAGDYALYFLTAADTQHRLIDKYFGMFNVSHLKGPSGVSGLRGLESDLSAGLGDPDEQRRLINIELLGAMGNEWPIGPLRQLLEAHNLITRLAAHVALLHLHDYTNLAEATSLMETSAGNPRLVQLQDRMSLYISEIRDSKAVPILKHLASSESDWVREAAVHALREMQSREAVPIFISALDDRVQLIRYDAVLALATIEKNWELAPSVDTFNANEERYISAWRLWWKAEGKQKYDKPSNSPALPPS